MNILLTSLRFYPATELGGSAKVIYSVALELVKRGHKVSVYCSNFVGNREKISQRTSVKEIKGITTVYASSFMLGPIGISTSPALVPILKREIKDFDIVHINGYRNFIALVAGYIARLNGKPYIVQAHGTLPPMLKKIKFKQLFDIFGGTKMLRNASALIATSEREANQYKRFGVDPNKIFVIYNGLDIKEFVHLPARGHLRDMLGIKDEQLVLFLGRINKKKGLEYLLPAFAKLRRKIDAWLWIVGPDDGYRDATERLIAQYRVGDRVRFLGLMRGEQKLSAFVDADVLVCPSYDENFGLVPMEALLCGTPVIVSEEVGCKELIKRYDVGEIVPYGDVEAILNKLEHIFANPDAARAKVLRGKEYILQNLGWSKVVDQIESVYDQVDNEQTTHINRRS